MNLNKTSVVVFTVCILLAALFSSKVSKLLGVSLFKHSAMPSSTSTTSLFDAKGPKTPVFFFSHGGPTFIYPDSGMGGDRGAYDTVKKIGEYIKKVLKPNFVIVVSAHWESRTFSEGIEIGIPKSFPDPGYDSLENELIYDFYGFPDHMYEEQFHTRNDLGLAGDIQESLERSGISAKLTERGIDHGVWVPLKVAFQSSESEYWDLDVPLVQVSLANSDDFQIHRDLGKVLSKYRSMGGVVICSGMSVHNLRDMGRSMALGGDMPYTPVFNKLVSETLKNHTGNDRFSGLQSLKTEHKKLLYQAHPTLEHFMPLVVAAGAADEDPVEVVYSASTGSLGWGIYQFGNYGLKL